MRGSGDRRQFSRIKVVSKVFIDSVTRVFTFYTRDLSEGGLQVRMKEKLSPMQVVSLALILDKDKEVSCRGQISLGKRRPGC